MANQLSRTDSSSNQDIRQRFNVKKTIIGVIVLLIGLFNFNLVDFTYLKRSSSLWTAFL